ncbi:dTDP-4-dehydrorhamnose reductase [Tistlia consotensis]|uniref:dTDP-4-dehydrorhamnose reductase n=1 Tax=Tistlia consotensis USBA 355 TaxID=560819 RepID=A0A1Y6B9N1_9PROT|nr:dTDP-4-dehydrorhamnose reductase [Tistlia consotensis]SME98709.1 dTDP-4-dehydrorhamnose reductase [Tistlia consotensis USBA 355]SNR58093.1 dTDP-4-dehydrorhamnose reductase [Tistlia consotensis]
MRLLVFGADGQVGRALAAAAGPRGVELALLDRRAADLCDPAAVAAAIEAAGADLVVNAAAYTAVDRAESDAATAFAVNEAGPAAIAEACARHDLPLVHFSTDYVFDGAGERPYREDDPTGPLGVYGRSKLAGEVAVRARWPRHLVLRTSWVYAAWGHNFVRTMLRLAEERDALSIVDDQRGCPTAAPDLAAAVLAIAPALLRPEAAWGTYHAAGAGIVSWYGFACEIFRLRERLTGRAGPALRPIPTSAYPTPAPRPRNSALDCALLRQTFGVALPPWQDSLERVLQRLLAAEQAG